MLRMEDKLHYVGCQRHVCSYVFAHLHYANGVLVVGEEIDISGMPVDLPTQGASQTDGPFDYLEIELERFKVNDLSGCWVHR